MGCVKASISSKNMGTWNIIEEVWAKMGESTGIATVFEETFGCYSENEKHIIFVCKDEEIPWKAREKSKKASTENLETSAQK